MRTSELIGPALDWAVAKCEGIPGSDRLGQVWVPEPGQPHFSRLWSPASDWSQGGPIIEREMISIGYELYVDPSTRLWDAVMPWNQGTRIEFGPTPLIAAMRCYVAHKMGDEVDVPQELIEGEEA